MSWHVDYADLKGWQTFLGSLLGFIALMGGALFNYHLTRRRDNRIRREEVISIASALYGEMIILRRSVARLANAVGAKYLLHGFHGDSEFDKHFVDQFPLPKPSLYPALANKVGLLDSKVALDVVLFYSRVEEAEFWLARLPEDGERPFTYGVNFVLDPAIEAVTDITATLRTIESMAGIVSGAKTPDLKKAISAQEHEKMLHDG